MQRAVSGTILVALQVFIAVLGQGAFTLCVRRDGTQALEWTAYSECQAKKSASQLVSAHHVCCEEEASSTGETYHSDSCTDYLLVAEMVAVVDLRPVYLNSVCSDLYWYMPFACSDVASHFTVLMALPPPALASEGLAELGVSVVLRC